MDDGAARPHRFGLRFVSLDILILAIISLSGLAWGIDLTALPAGGSIAAGSGSISSNGSAMTVHQASDRMVANWQSFNIGRDASVSFIQPGPGSAVLNRIAVSSPSQILGSIQANGQVFLLNPSGVIFGSTAQVNVGGLVASSLQMGDADFMAGKLALTRDGAAGSVVNHGSIEAAGGVVALVAPQVTNTGSIRADKGSVAMIGADRVVLDFNGDGLLNYRVEQGAIDALAANSGTLQADGGSIVMTSAAADALTGSVVNNSGVVQARTLVNRAGRILLIADMDHGQTIVGGRLDASAPNGGDGGFIETSAASVSVQPGAQVTTAAPAGNTGEWLIDPVDITVAASGGNITGSAIATALQSSNVTLDTSGSGSCSGATCSAFSGSSGHIYINDSISTAADLGAARTLTFKATGNIVMQSGKTIDATTGGNTQSLDVVLWADSDSSGSGSITLNTTATIKSNGGAITLGGGADPLTGYAVGDGTFSGSAYQPGITMDTGSSLVSAGGDITLHGTGPTATSLDVRGILINGGTLDSGAGKIALNGLSAGTSTANSQAVTIQNDAKLTSASSAADAISITGVCSSTSGFAALGVNIATPDSYVQTTNGGGIVISGTAGNATNDWAVQVGGFILADSGPITITGTSDGSNPDIKFANTSYTGQKAFSDVPNSTSDITLVADRLSVGSLDRIASSGALTIRTRTDSTTIGIGGASGTLSLPASYFTTSFVNGFSSITIGSATQTGDISTNGFTYYDPLTLFAGGSSGNVNLSGAVTDGSGAGNTGALTVRAGEDIIVAASGSLTTHGENITLHSDYDNNEAGGIELSTGVTLASNGGDIILGGGSNPLSDYAVGIDGGTNTDNIGVYMNPGFTSMDAGGGDISIFGKGGSSGATGCGTGRCFWGVRALGTISTSGSGTITINGISGTGSADINSGVELDGALQTASGAINVTGLSTSSGTLDNMGIHLYSSGSITTDSGDITLDGTGGSGSSTGNDGVRIMGDVTSTSGNITVNGTGGGSGASSSANRGVVVIAGGSVSTGSGDISMTGTGGSGGSVQNDGVRIEDMVRATTGSITITGTGGGTGSSSTNRGVIVVNSTGAVESQTGPIDITGTGGLGASSYGIYVLDAIGKGALGSSASDITLTADTMAFASTARMQSTGSLLVRPRSDGTTIGFGLGTGTLNIPLAAFSTYFVDGFSDVTVGSATAGDITVGATALSYYDPLTLKSAGNITVDASGSMTGAAGQNVSLTLWADADNNALGRIGVYDNAQLLTNGGDLVLAGGADDGSNGGVAADGIPDGYAVATSPSVHEFRQGVFIGSSAVLNAGGGDILMRGATSQQNAYSWGIQNKGNIVTSGTGSIAMTGDASGIGAGIDFSYGIYLSDTSTIQSASGAIDLTGVGGQNTTYGHGVVFEGVDVNLQSSSGPITIDATGSSASHFWMNSSGQIGQGSLGSSTSDITILSDSVNIGGELKSSGNLTIRPRTAGTSIGIAGGSGDLSLTAANFATNFVNGFAGITVGDGTAGAITVGGATTFNDSTTLQSNSTIAINGTMTANEALSLLSNGTISQSQAISVAGATTLAAGADHAITLNHTGNDFTGTLSISSAGDIQLVDSDTLSLGAVSATGDIDIATLSGNLTLTDAIASSSTSTAAIVLNAGRSAAAGTSSGGNILISGGSLSTGAGGRSTLYSGSVAGSTGLTALLGSASGRFRYNSDESATNYSDALGTGAWAIYREQPVLDVTPLAGSMTYGDASPVLSTSYSGGYVNGDASPGTVSGTATWTIGGATSTGGYATVGTHDAAYAGGLSSSLGYGFQDKAASTGELTVTKRNLSVSGLSAADKVYDTLTTVTLGGTAVISAMSGDSVTLGGTPVGIFADKNAASGKAVTVSGNTIGGADAGNYTLVQQQGLTADIDKADLVVSGLSAQDKAYDGTTAATLGGTAAISPLGSDVVALGGTAVGYFLDPNAGDGKVVSVSGNSISGADAGNYNLVQQQGITADISQVPLIVTAANDSRDESLIPYQGGNGVSYSGFVHSESASVLGGSLTYTGSSQGATEEGSYIILPAGLSSTNYAISYRPGTLTIEQDIQLTAVVESAGEHVAQAQYDSIFAHLMSPSAVNGTQQSLEEGGVEGMEALMGPGNGSQVISDDAFSGLLIIDRTGESELVMEDSAI